MSALPNRLGGKVSAFPVITGSLRLLSPAVPNGGNEFPLLLDPTIEHDANQLLVTPSGEIIPKANHVRLTTQDIADYILNWHSEGFNFLRSWVSIVVYRLDDQHLIKARKIIFSKVIKLIKELEQIVCKDYDLTIFVCKEIQYLISSFSPFALAARCALLAYDRNSAPDINVGNRVQYILKSIYDNVIERERVVI